MVLSTPDAVVPHLDGTPVPGVAPADAVGPEDFAAAHTVLDDLTRVDRLGRPLPAVGP